MTWFVLLFVLQGSFTSLKCLWGEVINSLGEHGEDIFISQLFILDIINQKQEEKINKLVFQTYSWNKGELKLSHFREYGPMLFNITPHAL